ncbi:cytochrome P450 [Chryseosolibacter indicus]|uniref:Cytochrome P450 n=1 Tax=Chryseosolibacter indicus TaxID=2782351 RepID=A0ABS5VWY3_9BACT|nr:cytochrome P450 [Chryseosolibacter indicus]MBT1705389.1 cytochrome P450 [Chryseosolibacter indicus]
MDQRSKIVWNPFTPGYFENPYDHLKICREQNPIHKVLTNSWIFFKYNDVNEILSSNKFEVSELSDFFKEKEPYIFKNSTACPYLSKGTKMWPMYLNNEEHKQTRAVMGKSLLLKGLDKALIEFADRINYEHQGKKHIDLVAYCARYIYLVLERILGVSDLGELEQIKQYSNWLARSQDVYVPRQVYQEVNSWLLWGKDIFVDSGFEKNVKHYADQSNLNYTEDDLYSISALTLMAAFETSKDNLSTALHCILQSNELIEYVLRCNQEELNILIEELFRFSSPLQYTIRVNKNPLEYDDIHIPAYTKLYLCLASANRDDTVFERPNDVLVDRNPNEHLSFGKGVHFCLGANIARQEMRNCLKPMVQFLKNYRIKNEEEIQWSKQIFMRTIESVALEARF